MKKTRVIFLLCSLLCLGRAWAQYPLNPEDSVYTKPNVVRNHFRDEIGVVTENDNYALQLRDGYYTNGFFIRYSQALQLQGRLWYGKGHLQKVVQGFELGQQIFNPVRFDSVNVATQDRPFSGYLYGQFDQRLFFRPNQLFQWSLALGATGHHSYAAAVQQWYHGAIDIYEVTGWDTQLKTEPSINLAAYYTGTVFRKPVVQRGYDISPYAQARLGNAFTDGTVGVLLRAGRMENHMNSVAFNARVSSDTNKAPVQIKEFYFFIDPSVSFQGYNATLQGGMFIENKGPKTVDIEPIVFSTRIGFHLAQNRWTWKTFLVNQGRQAKGQVRKENYISIQLAYRFGNLDKP